MPTILPHWLLLTFFGVCGLVFGSFGNVLIARVPGEQSIGGRSKCPHCKRVILAHELIPVLSFFLLGGRCAGCKKAISWQYPLVEIAGGLFFILAAVLFKTDLLAAICTAFGLWALLLIAAVDAKTQSIPDLFSLILAIAGLLLHLRIGHLSVWAPLIGMAFFFLQWALSRGKWVGSGDVLLAGAMGLFLGEWKLMIMALMAAYIIGAAYVTGLMLVRTVKANDSIAFGPFLVIGTLLAFVWGDKVLSWLML